MTPYHIPVLLDEVMTALAIEPGGSYIDATLGGGGYSKAMIDRGARVLSIDMDADAIAYVTKEVKEKGDWTIAQGNFRDIAHIAKTHGFTEVQGVVFDLGVSSFQLDTPQKGFSYRFGDAPLDMRLGMEIERTAADILKTSSEEALYEIFATYGEDERARAIARALVSARRVTPLVKASDVVSVVATVVPENERTETLSRIYQALRIAVNDELGALKMGLQGARGVLAQGGTLAVVSFHSLEDRIVKRFMDADGWHVATRKPVVAGAKEQMENRRSRSAKLRVAHKV